MTELIDARGLVERHETYSQLILGDHGAEGESDFMRGFAYGRFTRVGSEMALHWGLLRNRPANECPVEAEDPRNHLALIEAQSATIARLNAEVERKHCAYIIAHNQATSNGAAAADARAEVERMRGALRDAREYIDASGGFSPHREGADETIRRIDAALAPKEG